MGILDSIEFAHPKDVQDGKVKVTEKDILTNLPYVSGCHLCFDHHDSEETRNADGREFNHVLSAGADSAARVLYDYYGGRSAFPGISAELMEAVDKADSAKFSPEDILNPQGWELMSFLMDARTGLGRFREFRVSNHRLMMDLVDRCAEYSIEETLNLPDVRERVDLYRQHHEKFVEQIRRCTAVHGNLACLDLRNEDVIFVGNRFMIYALFPECNISMHVLWGLKRQNVVLAIGKSILDRSCATKVGDLMLRYGGGGHNAAGTCQIECDSSERVKREIVRQINADEASRILLAA